MPGAGLDSRDGAAEVPRRAEGPATGPPGGRALAPDQPLCLNTLGVVQYRLGQWQAAAETLQAAARANREGPTAYDLFFLAMTYRRTGRPEKAKECYEQAVRGAAQTGLAPHEVTELRVIRAEADAVLKGDVVD